MTISLDHAPSANMEEAGTHMTHIIAGHQGAIKIIQLPFWGVMSPSLYRIYKLMFPVRETATDLLYNV